MGLDPKMKQCRMSPHTPQIKDAATTLICRGSRLLMGRRQRGAVFLPGMFVFPGGRVDPSDAEQVFAGTFDPRCRAALEFEAHHAPDVYGVAALRELHEETGLVPKQAGVSLRFVYRAITPPDMPRRFDARFFMIDAEALDGDLDQFAPLEDELSDLQWLTPDDALAQPIAPITRDVLRHVQAGIPQDVVPWRIGDREDRVTQWIPR